MSPNLFDELIEVIETEEPTGRAGLPPESFNRRKVNSRRRKHARRSRSNDMAKRGMHQRRNKRSGW